MKKIIERSVWLLFAFTTFHVQATMPGKHIVETTFTVEGVCGACEERIENAALELPGVRMADWNGQTGKIFVAYNSKKITEIQIHEAIAAAGHSTDQVQASDASYLGLPSCCKYRDGIQKH